MTMIRKIMAIETEELSTIIIKPGKPIEEKDFFFDEEEEKKDLQDLILYNDDFNSFEHVIECLMKICEHDLLQAEQCTILIHHKGKCGVKRGSFDTLRPICEALLEKNLSAKIE